jgi:hypothetical protein
VLLAITLRKKTIGIESALSSASARRVVMGDFRTQGPA